MIDFHTHFFSRPFFDALAAQSPLPGSADEKLAAAAAKAGLELPPADVAAHARRWLGEMERHGLEHMVTFASLPEEVPAVAEAAALAGGRFTPFAICNPLAPDAARKAEVLLTEKGFRGLLFFPAMHRYDLAGEEAAAVFSALDRHRGVAVVHCGLLHVKLRDLLGLPRPFDFRHANPLHLAPAANRFRNVAFVVPHFGAGLLRETLMLGHACENVHVDTSSSNAWMHTQETETTLARVFARALGVFGPGRILFGTDSSTFPAGWQAARAREQEGVLKELGVNEQDRGRIFGENARALLRP